MDWASGPLVGRLLSHSVVPILCKKHLRFRVRSSKFCEKSVRRYYAYWLIELSRRKPLGVPAICRKRRRCDDKRRDASLRRAAIRDLLIFARIITFINQLMLTSPRVDA